MTLSIQALVHSEVARIARNPTAGPGAALDAQSLVDDLGLRSLELAQLVAVLELELDVEPFVERFAITDVRTVGDLVRAFSSMAAPDPLIARIPRRANGR